VKRVNFIDDYRGFAIISMIIVNYLAFYPSTPTWLKHAKGIGYTFADLVAPLFLFALGIMYRTSFIRRIKKMGLKSSYLSMSRRYLIIMFIGFLGSAIAKTSISYDWGILQAIGLAGILALPFLLLQWKLRLLSIAILAIFYQFIILTNFSDLIVNAKHGGPLASISWALLILAATVAGDLFHGKIKITALKILTFYCASFALISYLLILIFDLPTMKANVNVSYLSVSIALSSLVFILFLLIGEVAKIKLTLFTAMGKNPLLIFLIHYLLIKITHKIIDKHSSGSFILLMTISIFLLCFSIAYFLDRKQVYLKI